MAAWPAALRRGALGELGRRAARGLGRRALTVLTADKSVLVLNAGSSTVKYGLYRATSPSAAEELCTGLVDRIGLRGASITHSSAAGTDRWTNLTLDTHEDAFKQLIDRLTSSQGPISDGERPCCARCP